MRFSQWTVGLACALGCVFVQAQGHPQGALRLEQPYARSTVAGQAVGGGYLKISNPGQAADRLLSASTDVAQSVELHSMHMDGDIARMRQLDAIDIAAGQTIELKPGGLHLMFMGLKAPLKTGASFKVKLQFEKAQEMSVDFKVQ